MLPSKDAIVKYGERRRLADQAMIENLEERCKRKNRQEVADEELEEHPLLAATSVMHYLGCSRGPEDFPGYTEHMAECARVLGKASAEVEPGRTPFLFDSPKYLLAAHTFAYIMRGREAFSEMVIKHANQDVIGYWYREALGLAQELLLGLCVNTRGGIMLSDEEGFNNTVIFNYAEIADNTSRFWKVCDVIQKQFLVPTFFLMEFTPAQLEMLLVLFPSAHIIAITCPARDVEKQCLAILKARKTGPQSGGPAASVLPRRDRYGNVLEDDNNNWLNGDTPAGTMLKPTAMGKRKEKK